MKSLQNILSKNSKFHSLNDTIKESLRIGINDKPEDTVVDAYLNKTCLCIVQQSYKQNKLSGIYLRDVRISEITPYTENSTNYNVSGMSISFKDLEFDKEHFVAICNENILIRMIDNSIISGVYIIFNPNYNDKLIDFINSFSSINNTYNDLSIGDMFKSINIDVNPKDIEFEIGREKFNELNEIGTVSRTFTSKIANKLSPVTESLRIGINDQPETFNEDFYVTFKKDFYILTTNSFFTQFKHVPDIIRPNVSPTQQVQIYDDFEEVINKKRGFHIWIATFTKYDAHDKLSIWSNMIQWVLENENNMKFKISENFDNDIHFIREFETDKWIICLIGPEHITQTSEWGNLLFAWK